MSDYFEIVVPRERPHQAVRLVCAERGTVTILCVRSQVRITFEMIFPTQENMDQFLETNRSEGKSTLYGGRIMALTPTHLLESVLPSEDEDGAGMVVDISVLTRVFGVTPREFRTARMLAQSVIISKYRIERKKIT